MSDFVNFLERIGIDEPTNPLFKEAFIHPSYKNQYGGQDYERLEFIGDKVVNLIIAEYVYKGNTLENEGELSILTNSLISRKMLAKIGRILELSQFILLGNGEILTNGKEKDSIIGNVVESLVGAIYLQYGLDKARLFLLPLVKESLYFLDDFENSKGKLQEFCKNANLIEYRLVDKQGPDNCPNFIVECHVNNVLMGIGNGKNIKSAEQMAAKIALRKLVQ